MASSMVFKVACITVLVCMVLGLPLTHGAVTCGQVQTKLTPCLSYVKGSGGVVPQPCCDGIRSLNNEANTKPDRQAVCKCIKTAAAALPGVNPVTIADLPAKCGVNLPSKIDPSTDCNKIQ